MSTCRPGELHAMDVHDTRAKRLILLRRAHFFHPTTTRKPMIEPVDHRPRPSLNKSTLVECLQQNLGLNQRECKAMVDDFFHLITERLGRGEDVRIARFGSFEVRTKAPRPGRNPKTGESFAIQGRRTVKFLSGPKLKNQLQGVDRSPAAPVPTQPDPLAREPKSGSVDG